MSKEISIIGIDPGLRFTGWGIVSVEPAHQVSNFISTNSENVMRSVERRGITYVKHGIIQIPSNIPMPKRLRVIFDGLGAILSEENIDEAAIEEVFVNNNGASTMKLCMARGVAMLPFALNAIPVFEYPANCVKKTVLGAGGGHASKETVKNILKHVCAGFPNDAVSSKANDGTDALAIAICHAQRRQLNYGELQKKLGASCL
jgi:crossover junction endodeoxyribonuclease RuvC